MRIPLEKRLKRKLHQDIAELQDTALEAVYSIEENAVLHGGTAIWRCFDGNRFSEDLDFYFKPKSKFKELFEQKLESVGVKVSKFRLTQNTVYSKVESNKVSVAIEIALREFKKPAVSAYEKIDGTIIDIFTPSANELLLEKLSAFKSRRLIRDIYDVFHLSRFVFPDKYFEKNVFKLLEGLPEPADEQNLKNIVLAGVVPSFEQMVDALKRRFLH
ncbi:MAG: nucleotidyl transferase AbiEii/AbiGii toxin family protein [Candidatus Diapherotrites archaeon]|nr:nucleotidyl transferase AbiEii/AbiGii toxin family protein [Candidatus Diapherotrites archaeon]